MDAVSGSDCKILVTENSISSGNIVRMEGENIWTSLLAVRNTSAQGQPLSTYVLNSIYYLIEDNMVCITPLRKKDGHLEIL